MGYDHTVVDVGADVHVVVIDLRRMVLDVEGTATRTKIIYHHIQLLGANTALREGTILSLRNMLLPSHSEQLLHDQLFVVLGNIRGLLGLTVAMLLAAG